MIISNMKKITCWMLDGVGLLLMLLLVLLGGLSALLMFIRDACNLGCRKITIHQHKVHQAKYREYREVLP